MYYTDWIKVEDALPNDKEYVLTYSEYEGAEVAYCDRTRGTWWSDLSDWSLKGITHWMPLPELPGEGK